MGALQQRSNGFEGAVSGLSLVDLLQMKGMSRFTGRIAIERNNQTGLIFFRDGEVVHAELGRQNGKEAFAAIVGWGDGTFRSEPKISTTQQTISEGLQSLLLDVLRIQDEMAAAAARVDQADKKPDEKGGGTMQERLAAVNGVKEVALTKLDGTIVQAAGGDAEGLSAVGMYVVSTSGRIGDELGLGAYKGAVMNGETGHLLAMQGTQNHLFVSLTADTKPSVAEGEIRKALSSK